jgi:hypothetical protein
LEWNGARHEPVRYLGWWEEVVKQGKYERGRTMNAEIWLTKLDDALFKAQESAQFLKHTIDSPKGSGKRDEAWINDLAEYSSSIDVSIEDARVLLFSASKNPALLTAIIKLLDNETAWRSGGHSESSTESVLAAFLDGET